MELFGCNFVLIMIMLTLAVTDNVFGGPTNYEIIELIDDGSERVNLNKFSEETGFNMSLGAIMLTVGKATSQKDINEVGDDILPENIDLKTILPDQKDCGIYSDKKIYGGNRTELDEFPWIVLLYYELPNRDVILDCGGTLISKRYILTAAHCLVNKKLKYVRLGEYNKDSDKDCMFNGFNNVCLKTPPINVGVEKKIPHKRFDHSSPFKRNDIGLIRLDQDVKYTDYIQPICLPLLERERKKNYAGLNLTVAGWGFTQKNRTSDVKLKVKVPVMTDNFCRSIYNVSEYEMCAGGEENKNACMGDSGGPLMALSTNEFKESSWYAVAIVSYGPESCGSPWPTLYTRVSKYMGWILRHMR